MATAWVFMILVCVPAFMTEEITEWTCDKKSLDKCVGDGHFDLGKDIIPFLSDTALDQLCRESDGGESCFTALNNECESANGTDPTTKAEVLRTIEEIASGRQFMCNGHNRQTYVDHARPCLEEDRQTVETAGAKCLSKYNNETWYLDRSNKLNGYKYCSSGQQYIACQHEAVKKHCGKKSGEWAKNYHKSLWKPHFESIKCKDEEGVEGGAVVIMALGAGATIYCVFFVVLGFARDSNKCKCDGLKKHTRAGYQYHLQTQESK